MSAQSQAKARAFVRANDESLVVSGYAIGNGGEGGVYTLADGRVFRLDLEACRALPENYPKWDL